MAQQKDKMMDGGLAEIEDKVAPERQSVPTRCCVPQTTCGT